MQQQSNTNTHRVRTIDFQCDWRRHVGGIHRQCLREREMINRRHYPTEKCKTIPTHSLPLFICPDRSMTDYQWPSPSSSSQWKQHIWLNCQTIDARMKCLCLLLLLLLGWLHEDQLSASPKRLSRFKRHTADERKTQTFAMNEWRARVII